MTSASGARRLIRLNAGLAGFVCAFLFAAPPAISQLAKADRIVVEYSIPTHPALKQVYELVKKTQALEQVREILLPVQWPRTLKLELKDGGVKQMQDTKTPSSRSVTSSWMISGEAQKLGDLLSLLGRMPSSGNR